ncbi:MAG: DUF4011 domain-containing protein [Clostridia bacterium]|nr:DUF4011 domain-containing protein [Clostridia bacterium]
MDEKLKGWAEGLLDLTKNNNLINFKDTRSGTLDVIYPDFNTLFDKINSDATLEVYDPKFDDEDEDEPISDDVESVLRATAPRIKKNNQIIVYNAYTRNPIPILKQIKNKALTVMTETSVNITYVATAFILWKEPDEPDVYKAPILLTPITILNNSALTPFYIETQQDETIVNPTFAYKLKAEHNIDLPDFGDETIDEYVTKVESIVKMLGWSVSRSIKISTFSFLKMNMYVDLKDNSEKILENKNVRALLGIADFEFDGETAKKPLDLFQLHPIVDADSSQSRAMQMARDGVTFVLQGPPGTGKSQSITNIIAECLYAGKKVLFVSEKLAALNVVYEKLKQSDLADFCLELHSSKSNKKDVVKELCRVLNLGKTGVSPKAERELQQIALAKEKLDGYVDELHAERETIKRSLFEMIVEYNETKVEKEIDYVIRDIHLKGEEYFNEITEHLHHYVEMIDYVGEDYRKNCWFGFIGSDPSYSAKVKVKEALLKMVDFLCDLKPVVAELKQKFDIDADSVSLSNKYSNYCLFLSQVRYLLPSTLNKEKAAKVLDLINEQGGSAEKYLKIKGEIDAEFKEDIYALEASLVKNNLVLNYGKGIKRAFSKEYKEISNLFRSYNKSLKKVSYDEILALLDKLIDLKETERVFVENEGKYVGYFNSAYAGVKTDFTRLLNELKAVVEYDLPVGKIASMSEEQFKACRRDLAQIKEKIKATQDEHKDAIKFIHASFDPKDFNLLKLPIDSVIEKFTLCNANIDEIVNWINFYALFVKIREMDVADYLPTYIDEGVKKEEVVKVFKKIFFKEWFDYVIQNTPSLAELGRILHDRTVDQFAEKDQLQFAVNKAKIKAKVSSSRPDLDLITAGSPISILMREGEKKRRHKPIRQLLEEIPDLVQDLKPCFLMSPLSVSTFLTADFHFDTVIFDEASQIFPQDAVGAIYRGDQLICVGDSKQMPPTNFFNSTITYSENFRDEDITDYESILDLCNTAFPQIYLKWHYRSKYEELINFSNVNFYDSQLVTFPSVERKKQWIGVDFYYVEDGVFEHNTAVNKKEAERVVELIYENIEKYPDRSLGVIAFSTRQQALIEKALWNVRKDHPDKEFFFSSDRKEPFFIKNLETVQGDERDTVILSVAYGKDAEGKVLHNFGPLNKTGGERRLNVAVSRAKCNMQVVASMKYTDIDLNKSKAKGTVLLKEYLRFAELGAEDVQGKKRELIVDDRFCNSAYDYLRGRGFVVERNVGLSDRKIDLAVKNAEGDSYVLAIECDGNEYGSFETTTDRDRLRRQNLVRFGWDYYRLWSVDWCENNSDELKRLVAAVNKSLKKDTDKKKGGEEPKDPSFDVPIPETTFEFPKYVEADVEKLRKKHKINFLAIVKGILEVESPISEELLVKKMLFYFNKDKVTAEVNKSYAALMKNCSSFGIIRQNEFVYLAGQTEFPLRVMSDGSMRDVKYIALEELSTGLLEILRRNGSAEKVSLYKTLCSFLGYQRIGAAVMRRLEIALNLNADILDIDEVNVRIKEE